MLDRLLCQAVTEWITYRRIDVAPMAVMDALFKQKTSLMRQLGRGNETLLIGSADYEELMCGEATRLNPMMFQTTYNFWSMDEVRAHWRAGSWPQGGCHSVDARCADHPGRDAA